MIELAAAKQMANEIEAAVFKLNGLIAEARAIGLMVDVDIASDPKEPTVRAKVYAMPAAFSEAT